MKLSDQLPASKAPSHTDSRIQGFNRITKSSLPASNPTKTCRQYTSSVYTDVFWTPFLLPHLMLKQKQAALTARNILTSSLNWFMSTRITFFCTNLYTPVQYYLALIPIGYHFFTPAPNLEIWTFGLSAQLQFLNTTCHWNPKTTRWTNNLSTGSLGDFLCCKL